MEKRFFEYTGPSALTRGDYGVYVVGGHNMPEDAGSIFVFDPDFGEAPWISIEAGLKSGEWVEISEEEHTKL